MPCQIRSDLFNQRGRGDTSITSFRVHIMATCGLGWEQSSRWNASNMMWALHTFASDECQIHFQHDSETTAIANKYCNATWPMFVISPRAAGPPWKRLGAPRNGGCTGRRNGPLTQLISFRRCRVHRCTTTTLVDTGICSRLLDWGWQFEEWSCQGSRRCILW